MKLSVIIPTYNRSNLLNRTLETLVNQTIGKGNYEVLVVDNHSTDDTAEVIKTWEQKTNGLVRYLKEERPGAHYARNGSVKYAHGDVLYFTDDDVLAEPNCLEEILKPFAMDYRIASVTGQVLPHWECEPPLWVKNRLQNAYLSINTLPEDLIISSKDVGIFSNHQAILKSAFLEAGGFNPDIINGEWVGDNETGLNIKLEQLGYKFAYIRSAITYHIIPEKRMTQVYLNTRLANQGNSDAYTEYRQNHYTSDELNHRNKKMLYQQLKCFLFAKINKIRRKENWHMYEAKVYYYQHFIKYNRRLMCDADWRNIVLKNNWIEE